MIVYNPENLGEVLTRFTFPRQPYDEHLCLADYYAPVESGQMDVVAFQVVTVGQEATERFDRLQGAHDDTEAYFTHGPFQMDRKYPNLDDLDLPFWSVAI